MVTSTKEGSALPPNLVAPPGQVMFLLTRSKKPGLRPAFLINCPAKRGIFQCEEEEKPSAPGDGLCLPQRPPDPHPSPHPPALQMPQGESNVVTLR